jgi:hypothetical protein
MQGVAWRHTGLVFTREDGTAIHPQRMTSWFEQLARAAELPRIRLHDLRHSYATAALAAGIPAKVVSERLGDASVMITLDTYSHILPSMQEDAASAVARLILERMWEFESARSHTLTCSFVTPGPPCRGYLRWRRSPIAHGASSFTPP